MNVQPVNIKPEWIVDIAKKGDPIAKMTLEYFVEIYGSETGNLAIKLFPQNGIYIMGGVTRHIADIIKNTQIFYDNFYRKGICFNLSSNLPFL